MPGFWRSILPAPPSTESENDAATFLEEHQCPICMETFIDVCQTSCSHRFCKYCLDTWFKSKSSKDCPTCRSSAPAVTALPQTDVAIERFVTERFTEAQKKEREELKASRRTVTSMMAGVLPTPTPAVVVDYRGEPQRIASMPNPYYVAPAPAPVHYHLSNRNWRIRRTSRRNSRHRHSCRHRHRHHHVSRSLRRRDSRNHNFRRRTHERRSRRRHSSRRRSSRSSHRHRQHGNSSFRHHHHRRHHH